MNAVLLYGMYIVFLWKYENEYMYNEKALHSQYFSPFVRNLNSTPSFSWGRVSTLLMLLVTSIISYIHDNTLSNRKTMLIPGIGVGLLNDI